MSEVETFVDVSMMYAVLLSLCLLALALLVPRLQLH